MGSTLLVLRNLLEAQLDIDTTTTTSDPTSTLLNNYINKAIRKIIRRDRPQEYKIVTPIGINTVSGQNTVAVPSTIAIPEMVYYLNTSGKYQQLKALSYDILIQQASSENLFDSSYTGTPNYYAWQGGYLIFDRYFSSSQTNGVKVLGVKPLTTLSLDASTSDLPEDYDMLITYEAASLYYQKDADFNSISVYNQLIENERKELKIALDDGKSSQMYLDPNIFCNQKIANINNPGVFFQ